MWEIPAEKMKMRIAHIVPLAKQSIGILKEVEPLTGQGRYVFPSLRTGDRPMSNIQFGLHCADSGMLKRKCQGMGFGQWHRRYCMSRVGHPMLLSGNLLMLSEITLKQPIIMRNIYRNARS